MIENTYIINLEKHIDRKKDCIKNINNIDNKILGEIIFYKAINGNKINFNDLKKKNIKIRKEWKDFLSNRSLTKGELGCALSHYNIWQKVADSNSKCTYIMEDDINFHEDFNKKLKELLLELKKIEWDFCFLDRKLMYGEDIYIDKSVNLIKPGYSFWLNSYLINANGARKLINTNFLQRIIPVDEYVPMMYYKSNQIVNEIGDRIYPEEFMNNYNNYDKYNKLIAYSSKNELTYIRYEYDFKRSSTENSEEIKNIENFFIKKKKNAKNFIIFLALLFILINKFSNLKKYF
jgi:GR25 family glycosyltransferase involved in LPS biosynthesis